MKRLIYSYFRKKSSSIIIALHEWNSSPSHIHIVRARGGLAEDNQGQETDHANLRNHKEEGFDGAPDGSFNNNPQTASHIPECEEGSGDSESDARDQMRDIERNSAKEGEHVEEHRLDIVIFTCVSGIHNHVHQGLYRNTHGQIRI